MTDEFRGEIRNMLDGIEADSGDIDAATSARLQRRLDALIRPDVVPSAESDLPALGRIIPLEPTPPEPTLLPIYGQIDEPQRRGWRTPLVVSTAALVAAALLVAVLLPSRQGTPSLQPDLLLAEVLAPIRAATDTPMTGTDTVTQVMTIRNQREESSRVRELRADGSGQETVLDRDGEVLAELSDRGPNTYRFGPFSYAELRALPTSPDELATMITSSEPIGALAEIGASPVVPPAVRAAAIEVLSAEGFAWRLDDDGLIIGARGTQPSEQIAIDPATGRVLAYGWVADAQDRLLDAPRVTIWR